MRRNTYARTTKESDGGRIGSTARERERERARERERERERERVRERERERATAVTVPFNGGLFHLVEFRPQDMMGKMLYYSLHEESNQDSFRKVEGAAAMCDLPQGPSKCDRNTCFGINSSFGRPSKRRAIFPSRVLFVLERPRTARLLRSRSPPRPQ
jgi:hypothetical protein